MLYLKNLLNPYRGLPKEVYIIFISRIVNAVGCFVMPLMTLILTERIGMSKEAAGLYISISGVLFMPASMVGGKLADMIGRKILIVVFDTLAAILYIICGFIEPSMNLVYVMIAAGACMMTAGPAHDSLIADVTTPNNRSSAYALTYMGWNIGFAVGPIIGGMLYKDHLPLVFIGDAVTALIAVVLIGMFIQETLHKTEEETFDESRILEQREEGSIISVLLKRPILLFFGIITFWYNFAYAQWSFMLPMHIAQNFGDQVGKLYGILASFNGVIVIFGTPLLTKYTEKTKNIRKMVYGGLLYAFGFGMLGLIYSLPFFFISATIFTLGEIILAISVTPFIVNHTPASHRGRMSAVLPMILGLGHTLGPAGMGKILSYISIETGWILIGGLVFIASGFMYLLEKYDDMKRAEKIAVDTKPV